MLRMVSVLAMASKSQQWHQLRVAPAELRLEVTLRNGQAFGWALGDDGSWRGVLGGVAVALRELDDGVECRCLSAPALDVDALRAVLADYFQLDVSLADQYAQWRSVDARTAAVAEALPGLRILRQDPTECLFSFICSSNNNIARITGILERLRAAYGRPLDCPGDPSARYFAFPAAEALAAASEKDLRDLGLGYRARYVHETALILAAKGAGWLEGLRQKPREDVQQALVELPGVGRKVADCVALFSLNKAAAIPVDVHVWNIACRDYDPSLQEAKSLTPSVYERVGDLFRDRFGERAGWAQSMLFAGELPAFRTRLSPELQAEMAEFRAQERQRSAEKRKAKASPGSQADAADGGEDETPSASPPTAGAVSTSRDDGPAKSIPRQRAGRTSRKRLRMPSG